MTNPPFGFDVPEDSPGFLLWQTTMCWQRAIKKALEPHDISHAQFVILALLLWFHGKGENISQQVIVTMSKLDKMTVSKSLKKLVALTLVERHENQEDTRSKTVQLTDAGVCLAKKLVPIVEGVDANFFGKLSKGEEQSLLNAFRKLAE